MANQEHLDIFWQGADIWNQWRSENPPIKPDLSYADLSGVDLSNSSLSGDLSYANLSGANLTKATFFEVNLSGAIFQSTNFTRSIFIPKKSTGFELYVHIIASLKFDLGNTDLSHANLSNSNLTNSYFGRGDYTGTRFEKANIIEAIFKEFNLEEIDLSGANLIELDLRGFKLKNYCLMNCDLSKSDLSGMDLSNINLGSANLNNTKIARANLSNANLTKANLKNADLSQANLNYAKFHEADCEEINLNESDLSYSYFFKANMKRATLHQSKCYRTDFTEANLELSLFTDSVCLGAIFYMSYLQFTGFKMANIASANFQKAKLQKSFLYAANAIGCNFSDADLTDACLAAMRGIDANFYGTTLTGACIEDWNINANTSLQNTKCDYIYNRSGWDEDGNFLPSDRLPHDPAINFKAGEFERFIQKAQNTVDLIFTNGIDWQAFLQAFLKLKSETGDELSIYSIEDKWDNYFVVRVNVPSDVNKKELEGALRREYELREDKRFLQQCVTSLTMSLESLSEAQRKQSMSGDTFNIDAPNSTISITKDNATQNIHSINQIFEQHQDISEIAAEIQKLLTQVQNQGLSESDAQEKVADDLANKAKSDSTMMEKLKSIGTSFGSASGKALVTEVVKAVFKLALNKAGIHLE
ncbi:MAG: pentapeptide repeat-containing protein [Pseudanabaena sp.]|jgi:uncharacterized protein YjbI with pentapeptide repeats